MVDATGRFGSNWGAGEAGVADAELPRGDVFDAYGTTEDARAAIGRVLSGAEREVVFTIEREGQSLEVRLRALHDAAGETQVVGAVGTSSIVTERVRLERAKAASRARKANK